MSSEDLLKQEILMQHDTAKSFCEISGIPNSTLASIFKRGIKNAGVTTMIKICDSLSIDLEALVAGHIEHKSRKSPSSVSEEAQSIAEAFDRADEKDKGTVRQVLGEYMVSPTKENAG